MNRRHVFQVFRKDGLEILRDRRTLFVNVVLPLLLYPLMLLFGWQVVQLTRKQQTEPARVLIVNAPALIASDLAKPPANQNPARDPFAESADQPLKVLTADADAARLLVLQSEHLVALRAQIEQSHQAGTPPPAPLLEQLRAASATTLLQLRRVGAVAAVVRLADAGGKERLAVLQDDASRRSDATEAVIQHAINEYRDSIISARLRMAQLPVAALHPLDAQLLPVAPKAEAIRTRISGFLPLLLVVLAASGAFFPALDLISGERERGTLESLLSWPARRRDIFIGKLLVACTAAAASVLLNIASLTLSIAVGGSQLGKAGIDFGGIFSVGIGALALCTLVLLPLTITLAAVALAVTGLASTAKEAQNYLTPFFLVVFVSALVGIIPGTQPGFVLDLLPVIGPVLTLKESLQAEHLPWGHLLLTAGGSVALTWVVVGWSTRLLEDERFRYPGLVRAGWGRFRRWGTRPPTPGGLEAMGVYALAVAGFTLLSGYADVNPLARIAVPLLLFAATPALVHCWLGAYDIRQTLSWRRPRRQAVLMALLLVPCAVMLSVVILQLQGHVLHGPSQGEETVREVMQSVHDLGGLPLMLASMAVLPGICEELLFRGTLLSGFSRGIGRPGAVVVSAFLFAALHGDPSRFLPQAALGVVLGILTLRTGSIIPAMIVHAGHNSVVLIISQYGDRLAQIPGLAALVAWLNTSVVAVPVLGVVGVSGMLFCLYRAATPTAAPPLTSPMPRGG